MKKYLGAILFAASMAAVHPAAAEDKVADVTDMQALRDAVRSDKKALVASTLKLTPAEATANELMAADEVEIKARRSLHNRLMRGVPTRILAPNKAARYLQLETKIRAVQAYDIAANIPLIR